MRISTQRLDQLFSAFRGKHIAVVGDLMIDRYYWGSVSRISPEAPVPVVEVDSQSTRLGGAANVANNIASLGGIPLMLGVTGDDEAGALLRGLARDAGFSDEGIITDPHRPTTVKTRVIAHHQHVVRIDQESKADIDDTAVRKILEVLEERIQSLQAIVLEDYNKGVVVRPLIQAVVQRARKQGIPVTVDPKFNNFFEYRNVTVFKPNRKETEEALGIRLHSAAVVEQAGLEIMKRLEASSVLLTLGEEGMALFEGNGRLHRIPTKARRVADVSGAGDTVISTLTIALAGGATVPEAAVLANYAGGVVCGEVGIVPIEPQALRQAIEEDRQHEMKA